MLILISSKHLLDVAQKFLTFIKVKKLLIINQIKQTSPKYNFVYYSINVLDNC